MLFIRVSQGFFGQPEITLYGLNGHLPLKTRSLGQVDMPLGRVFWHSGPFLQPTALHLAVHFNVLSSQWMQQNNAACCRPPGSSFNTRAGAWNERARPKHMSKHSSPEAAFITITWGGGTTDLISCRFLRLLMYLSIVLSVVRWDAAKGPRTFL